MRSNVTKSVVGLIAVLALGALSAAPAFASGKPLVETKAATKVAENEATLNAVVNPNGAATKYYFEYWREIGGLKTEATKTAEVSAGSGTSNVEAIAALTGLKAETQYRFKIVATNTNGTSEGAADEFSTTAAAGPPEFSKNALDKPANKFTVKGGSVGFKSASGTTYGCDSSSAEGTITGVKTATLAFTFQHCGDDGFACTTTGAEEGHITTGTLPAQLVYLSKEKHEVGLVVNYHETDFAAWHCPTVTEAGIHGSIIVPITPVNTKTASFTMDFASNGKGKQVPASFEGAEKIVNASPTMSLLGGFYEEGSLEDSTTMTDDEAIEVKA